MARTKEFDPEAALRAALELFWRRGYEATSMSDLVEHLGVGRASIYATFGNKHDLYMKALESYDRAGLTPMVRELSQPGPALPPVRAIVRRYAAEAADEQLRSLGCLVTNAARSSPRTTRPRPDWSSATGTSWKPCCARRWCGRRHRASCRPTAIRSPWRACCWC